MLFKYIIRSILSHYVQDGSVMEIHWPEGFPALRTERLLLRQVAACDSTGIFSCFSDPETMRYMGTPLQDQDSVDGIVEEYAGGFAGGTSLVWALEEVPGGNLAGTAGYEEFNFLDSTAELGFTLLRGQRGRGLMHEALWAILEYGFTTLGINRIEARIIPGNQAALKLVERLGFSQEGILRESVWFRDTVHDQLLFALLNREWRK